MVSSDQLLHSPISSENNYVSRLLLNLPIFNTHHIKLLLVLVSKKTTLIETKITSFIKATGYWYWETV